MPLQSNTPTTIRLCLKCQQALFFPGISHPLLPPESLFTHSPWAFRDPTTNPSGPYTLKHDQHRFKCHYFHQDELPEPVELARTSVSEGCVFCRLLLTALRQFAAREKVGYDGVRVSMEYLWDEGMQRDLEGEEVRRWVLQARLLVRDPGLGRRRGVGMAMGGDWVSGPAVFWPLARGSGAYGQLLGMPAPMAKDDLGEQALEFLRSNIRRCVSCCSHTLPVPGGFVPTRLIDVRGDQLRVVETQTTTADLYSTLSYCWGTRAEGLSQLRLTKDTRLQLQSGFPLEAMSAVQKDAVLVTKALGIPYLWIDALCILQNDAPDWERESSLLHKIYGNAHVTICNLKSASCQQGFLSNSPLQAHIPFDTISPPDEAATDSYEIGPGSVTGCAVRVFERDTWSRLDFDNTQWITRAWTFQEGTLSTRMVMFAQSGLYFSCSSGLVWEYGRILESPLNFSVCSIVQRQDGDGSGSSGSAAAATATAAADIYRKWNLYIATQFSGRQATYLTDSLPALSGTAQIFAEALGAGDGYVAGLWKGDLLGGLFWKMEGALRSSLAGLLQTLDDSSQYIGPSWGWVGRAEDQSGRVAKVRAFGPGRCNLYPATSSVTIRTRCEKLQAETTPSGVDKYGKISSAALVATARVYPLALGWYHLPDEDEDASMAALTDTGNAFIKPADGGVEKLAFSYHLDFFPNMDAADPGQSWKLDLALVLLGSINYRDSESGEESGELPCGLIVHRAKAEDEYWRVGTWGPATVTSSDEDVSDLDMDAVWRWKSMDLKVV